MFESNITAKALIDGLKDEIDVSAPFEDLWYIGWINEVEQTLYGGLIEERKERSVLTSGADSVNGFGRVSFSELNIKSEDVLSIYADETSELTKMDKENATIFPKSYYIEGATVYYKPKRAKKISVYHRVKPTLKTEKNIETETIKLPVEFLEMLKEKIRGEAFAAVGEYGESSNHLTAYNQYLDTFVQYLAMRQETFGR